MPSPGEVWIHKRRRFSVTVVRVGSTIVVRNDANAQFEYTPAEFSGKRGSFVLSPGRDATTEKE